MKYKQPNKESRKGKARGPETNSISDGITATTNSRNAYLHGKFNAKQTIPEHLDTYALLLMTFVDPNLIHADKNLLKFSKMTLN